MTKWIILTLEILVVSLAIYTAEAKGATECQANPIYCKILKLNPKLEKKFAMELSDKISAKAKAAKVNPLLSLAILMQESTLRHVNTFKTSKVEEEYCKDGSCFKIVKEINEVNDMGIAQINIGTAKMYNFDIERLYKGDLDYTLDCHYALLKEKMRICASLGEESFSCYHSINEPYRSIYVDMVKRWL